MGDEPQLSTAEQEEAAAYKKTGEIPDDPLRARIVQHLLDNGLVKVAKKKTGAGQ